MTEHTIVHSTFTLERVYPVPTHEAYRAWADPKIKVHWFANGAAGYELDFRAGGIERNRAAVNGKDITWESLYREIVPDERIVYTSVLSEDGTVATVSLTTVELVPQAEGTRLVVVEAGAYLDGKEQPAWREHGTGVQLDTLGKLLAEAS